MPILAASILRGVGGEGERADEQAHGEADPAQQGRAMNVAPAGPAGHRREAGADHRPDRAEHAELLADQQAEQRRRAAAAGSAGSARRRTTRPPRQAEQGDDEEHHPWVDRMFEPLERRMRLALAERDGQRGEHPGDGRVDPACQHQQPQQTKPIRNGHSLRTPKRPSAAIAAARPSAPARAPEVEVGGVGERDDRSPRRCRRRWRWSPATA